MALSGSYNWGWDGREVITTMLRLLAVIGVGDTPKNYMYTIALPFLNAMVKHWAIKDGIALWTEIEAALFQSYEGYEYNIGSTGDNCATTYVKTELSAGADSGDSTIDVDSDDNISNADKIGIELDDYSLQWTTVNGAPSGDTITLATTLTDDAAENNHVYAYTNKIAARPLVITEARLRSPTTNDDHEVPIEIYPWSEYKKIENKEETGPAELISYRPLTTGNGKLYVWPACDDVQKYIKFTAKLQVQDFSAVGNDPHFSNEWNLALAYNLAVYCCYIFGKETTDKFDLKALALKNEVSVACRKAVWRPTGISAGPVAPKYTHYGVTPKG